MSTFVTHIKESGSPKLREVALNGLLLARSHLGEGHLQLVRQALDDTSPMVRDTAIFVLGSLRHEASVRPICELLQDEEPTVRAQACEALAEIGSPVSINYLKPLISCPDQDEQVRNAAYEALWRICRQNSIELLPFSI